MKSFILAPLLVQGIYATGLNWLSAQAFSCPDNQNNECNSEQKSGWNFNSIPQGNVNKIDDYDVQGFECKDGGGSSAKFRVKRTGKGSPFSGNCLSGSAGKGSGPKISGGKKFSPTNYYVSADRDVKMKFNYDMPDGSKCSHTSSCKAGGSQIKNSQCGGAVSVSFQLHKDENKDCGIKVHQIDFDCSPPVAPPPKSVAPPTPPKSVAPPSPPKSIAPPPKSVVPPSDVPPSVVPPSVVPPSVVPPSVVPPSVVPPSVVPPSDVPSSVVPPSVVPPSVVPPSVVPPSDVPPSDVPPSVVPPSSQSPSPPPSSVVVSPEVNSPPPSSILVPSSTPSAPEPEAPCPPVLPQCLQTWLFLTDCKDNADHSCFCTNSKFTETVYSCVSAWGLDDSSIQKAINYFMGLCAPAIPNNPAIITACPTDVSIAPVVPTPPVTMTSEVVITSVAACPSSMPAGGYNGTGMAEIPSSCTSYATSTITTCPVCEAGPQTTAINQGYTAIPVPDLSTTVTVPVVGMSTSTNDAGSQIAVLTASVAPTSAVAAVAPTSNVVAPAAGTPVPSKNITYFTGAATKFEGTGFTSVVVGFFVACVGFAALI